MSEQESKPGKSANVSVASASEPPKPASDSQVVILSPEAVREAAASGTALQVTIASAHSGPLPAPATLRAYREIVPGLPETIIKEFAKESSHRRATQTTGQWGAIVVATAAIVGGVWLGFELKSALAAFAVIGPVCGVVGIAQFLEFWLKAK